MDLSKYKIKQETFSSLNVKLYQEKLKGKGKEDGTFVVEGIWCLDYLLKSSINVISILFCQEYINKEETEELLVKMFSKDIEIIQVSKKVFEKISTMDGPDGVMVLASFPKYDLKTLNKKKDSLIVILDGLETSGNIGTIIRASDGLEVDAIFVTNRRAKITNSKTIKSSMGGAFFVPIVEWDSVEQCQAWLIKNDYTIYLTDTSADKYYFQEDYLGKVAFVAGNERYGIDKKWYKKENKLISIPMLGQCDSLNVCVSTTIVMSEISMQQHYKIGKREIKK